MVTGARPRRAAAVKASSSLSSAAQADFIVIDSSDEDDEDDNSQNKPGPSSRPAANGLRKPNPSANTIHIISSSPSPSPQPPAPANSLPAAIPSPSPSTNALGKRPLAAKALSHGAVRLAHQPKASGSRRPLGTSSASPAPTTIGTRKHATHEDDDDDDDDDFFVRRVPSRPRPSDRSGSSGRPGSSSRALRRSESATEGGDVHSHRASVDRGPSLFGGRNAVPEADEDDEEEDDDDDDGDGEDPPSSLDVNGRKRKRPKHARLPSWTRTGGDASLFGTRSSHTTPAEAASGGQGDGDLQGRSSSGRRGHDRDGRSISLTPPPELDSAYRRKITEIVDSALAAHRKKWTSESPSDDDEPGRTGQITSPSRSRTMRRARPLLAHPDGDDVMMDDGDDASGSASAQLAVHPDLAPYLRGAQAAEQRRLAKIEEEKQRKAKEEARQKQLAEQSEEQRIRNERRKRNIEEAQMAATRGRRATKGTEDEDEGGVIALLSSSDSESAGVVKTSANGHGKAAPNTTAVIGLSDDDEGEGGAPSVVERSTTTTTTATAVQADPSAQDAHHDAERRISLTLRSKTGKDMLLKVKPTTTFRKMLDHFLSCTVDESQLAAAAAAAVAAKPAEPPKATRGRKKQQQAEDKPPPPRTITELAAVARMMWDGELLDLDSAVESVEELEDDEIIDVLW